MKRSISCKLQQCVQTFGMVHHKVSRVLILWAVHARFLFGEHHQNTSVTMSQDRCHHPPWSHFSLLICLFPNSVLVERGWPRDFLDPFSFFTHSPDTSASFTVTQSRQWRFNFSFCLHKRSGITTYLCISFLTTIAVLLTYKNSNRSLPKLKTSVPSRGGVPGLFVSPLDGGFHLCDNSRVHRADKLSHHFVAFTAPKVFLALWHEFGWIKKKEILQWFPDLELFGAKRNDWNPTLCLLELEGPSGCFHISMYRTHDSCFDTGKYEILVIWSENVNVKEIVKEKW